MFDQTDNQEQQQIGITRDNTDFNDSNSLTIRLNTDIVLRRMEMYLRGYKETLKFNDDNQPFYKFEKVGRPKANDDGVHAIMFILESIINTQVVQGQTKDFDSLYNQVAIIREDMSEQLMINLEDYGISLTEYEGIIDTIISQLKFFLSRTVGNKEKDSYNATIRHSDSSNTVQKGGGFKLFG